MPNEEWLRPTEVFARRLREWRKARGLTQAQLTDAMERAGQPIGKKALLQIESGARRVSLDEALALASCLGTAPAVLLSPPDGSVLSLTATQGVDAGGLRNWLVTGDPLKAWPATPTAEDRATLEAILEEELGRAFVDAMRASTAEGKRLAVRAATEAVEWHERALAAIAGGDDVERPDRINRRTRPRKGSRG